MLPPKLNLPADQRKLLKHYSGLDERGRESLLAFAEFLLQRQGEDTGQQPERNLPPKSIPRPADESVVGAIKRLSESYFMLDKSLLFSDTSSLMTSHIMQGRPAEEVINELEALFERIYQEHLTDD